MSYLILDLIVLAIILIFIWRGAAKGFILSFCGLLAVLVAFGGASFAAKSLSPAVASALEPKLASVLEERLKDELHQPEQNTGKAVGDADRPLQDVLNVLKDMGLYKELIDHVNQAVEQGMTTVAANAAAQVAAAIAQSIAYRLIFILAFSVILVLWSALSKGLDLVARLPGLHFLNKTGGAVIGFAKAILVLFLAAWLLQFLGNIVPEETVAQTRLLRFFMTTNPLSLISGGTI